MTIRVYGTLLHTTGAWGDEDGGGNDGLRVGHAEIPPKICLPGRRF